MRMPEREVVRLAIAEVLMVVWVALVVGVLIPSLADIAFELAHHALPATPAQRIIFGIPWVGWVAIYCLTVSPLLFGISKDTRGSSYRLIVQLIITNILLAVLLYEAAIAPLVPM